MYTSIDKILYYYSIVVFCYQLSNLCQSLYQSTLVPKIVINPTQNGTCSISFSISETW